MGKTNGMPKTSGFKWTPKNKGPNGAEPKFKMDQYKREIRRRYDVNEDNELAVDEAKEWFFCIAPFLVDIQKASNQQVQDSNQKSQNTNQLKQVSNQQRQVSNQEQQVSNQQRQVSNQQQQVSNQKQQVSNQQQQVSNQKRQVSN